MNIHVSGHYQNQFDGTININGTTSLYEVDLANEAMLGLYGVFSTPGTLNFLVRPGAEGGVQFPKATLKDGSNAAIAVTVSGTTAISGEVLKPLAPYRYVTVVISNAQASGAYFRFITKA